MLAGVAPAIGQVHAVQPQPVHHLHMPVDDQRHIPRMRDHPQRIGSTGDVVFLAVGHGQAHAGDFGGIEHGRQPVGKGVKVKDGRGDEVNLRAVGVGHRAVLCGFQAF